MSDANSPLQPAPEPSMEEIIASISRTIAEDGRGNKPVAPAVAGTADILDLTEAVNEDGSVRKIKPADPRADMPGVTKDSASTAASVRVVPDPPHADSGAGANRDRGPLLSAAASEAAATAFAGLGAAPPVRRNDPGLALVAGERTLDEIVCDTLRPLLQDWLDGTLPGLSSGWCATKSRASPARPGGADRAGQKPRRGPFGNAGQDLPALRRRGRQYARGKQSGAFAADPDSSKRPIRS